MNPFLCHFFCNNIFGELNWLTKWGLHNSSALLLQDNTFYGWQTLKIMKEKQRFCARNNEHKKYRGIFSNSSRTFAYQLGSLNHFSRKRFRVWLYSMKTSADNIRNCTAIGQTFKSTLFCEIWTRESDFCLRSSTFKTMSNMILCLMPTAVLEPPADHFTVCMLLNEVEHPLFVAPGHLAVFGMRVWMTSIAFGVCVPFSPRPQTIAFQWNEG